MKNEALIKSIRYLDIENKIALGICKASDFKTKKNNIFSDLGIDDVSPAASSFRNTPNVVDERLSQTAGEELK